MDREPVEVFPLAQYVAEEMEARGWTANDVAARMGGDYATNAFVVDLLLAVHEDKLIVDDDTFAGLSRAFGVSEQYFRNLDAVWRKWPDRRSEFECPEHLLSDGKWAPDTPHTAAHGGEEG